MQTVHSLLTTEFEKQKANALRTGARYRMADFARFLGVSHTLLRCWLDGKHRPSADLARRVEVSTGGRIRAAEILGLDLDGNTISTDTP